MATRRPEIDHINHGLNKKTGKLNPKKRTNFSVSDIEKSKRQKKELTHITDKSKLSTEDKMKLSLCKHFVRFANSKKLKLKDVAKMIDIPIQRLSEITNYKINKYTVDQLIKNLSLLAKHDAQIREYLVFLEQAAELPALTVTETKRLTRDIREATIQHAAP